MGSLVRKHAVKERVLWILLVVKYRGGEGFFLVNIFIAVIRCGHVSGVRVIDIEIAEHDLSKFGL